MLLKTRAHVQLLGHKHQHEIERVDDSVVIGAGAVHPSRMESGWVPRYNAVGIRVRQEADNVVLQVHVWPRAWREGETAFGPEDERDYEIALGAMAVSHPTDERSGVEMVTSPEVTSGDEDDREEYLAMRRLGWGFHSPQIGFVTKLKILMDLELVEPDDDTGRVQELFVRAFDRARERQIAGRLWAQVDHELAGVLGPNPFEEG